MELSFVYFEILGTAGSEGKLLIGGMFVIFHHS